VMVAKQVVMSAVESQSLTCARNLLTLSWYEVYLGDPTKITVLWEYSLLIKCVVTFGETISVSYLRLPEPGGSDFFETLVVLNGI
jgi:hypothetical protein